MTPLRQDQLRGAALILLLLATAGMHTGCSGDATDSTSPNGSSAKSVSGAVVQVDNSSDDEWDVFVDGKSCGKVAPKDILVLDLKPKQHEIRVARQGGDFGAVQVTPVPDKVTVVNPFGTSVYVLMTAQYTTGSPFAGSGPSSQVVEGEKTIQVDYGLLEAFPGTVMIETHGYGPQAYVQTATRTKLCRKLPENVSTAEAAMLLTGNLNIYDADPYDVNRAVEALGEAAAQPGIKAILIDAISSGRGAEAAFRVLKSHSCEIPDEKITAWFTGHEGTGEQTTWFATQLLLNRNDGDSIVRLLPECPEPRWNSILGGLREAPVHLRKKAIINVLEIATNEHDSAVLSLLQTRDLELDSVLLKSLDAYADGIRCTDRRGETRKQNWSRVLGDRICHSATNLPPSEVKPRLAAYVAEPQGRLVHNALRALLEIDGGDEVASMWPGMDRRLKSHAISAQIQQFRRSGHLTSHDHRFYDVAIQDSDVNIRYSAFSNLAEVYKTDASAYALNLLKAAAAREPDIQKKQWMESSVKSLESLPVRTPEPVAPAISSDGLMGRSEKEVRAVLGRPTGQMSLGGRKILLYQNGRIELEEDKVVAVKSDQ